MSHQEAMPGKLFSSMMRIRGGFLDVLSIVVEKKKVDLGCTYSEYVSSPRQ